MNNEQLGDEIARLAAVLEAGSYRLISLIGEFDTRGGWAWTGAVSCAHWLSWRIGLDLPAARERVRVRKALLGLPMISSYFERGILSYSKVRALTRVATKENEEALVNAALSSTAADLERICRKFRSVLDYERGEAAPSDAEARRTVKYRHLDDGRMCFSINLPADEGARFLAAIEAGTFTRSSGVSAETSSERKNRADGLMVVAESFLAEGPRTRRGGAPHEVQLVVTTTELAQQTDGALITNGGSTGVSAETARRLTCDAAIVPVVEDGHGKVLNVGRRTRTVPGALRRALRIRDKERCAFPGRTHTLFLDAHHIEHWANGGVTALGNLILLCRRHHTFVHEHHYKIELDAEGRATFIPPNAAPLPRVYTPPAVTSDPIEALAELHAAKGLALDELSLLPPYYDAEPIDYVHVIDVLCDRTFPKTASPQKSRTIS